MILPPTWLYVVVGLAVWVVGAGLVMRFFQADYDRNDLGPVEGDAWPFALFAGFAAGVFWWFLLLFGVPLVLGIWLVWKAAMLVAHPPRRRLPPTREHWTDSLPADMPLERVIELAEQKAAERQRPNPSARTWM